MALGASLTILATVVLGVLTRPLWREL